jgi:RNA polymerase-binding transcription factor DksA
MHSSLKRRLEHRRDTLRQTLEHIRNQQHEVETNTEWKDLWAQRRRSELLAELFGWYHGRLERIDHALRRSETDPQIPRRLNPSA